MQVLYNNFAATLPFFIRLLETCDFYAFDNEMTGVGMPKVSDLITFSSEESYHCKRMAASHYNLIQIGLCLFHRSGTVGDVAQYTASPFNFVLFPQSMEEAGGALLGRNISTDIVMGSSALAFLRRHGMDFQSWVYEGIGYCDEDQARVWRDHWKEQRGEGTTNAVAVEKGVDGDLFSDEERSWVEASIKAAKELQQRADAAGRGAATKCVCGLKMMNKSASEVEVPGGREVLLECQSSRSAREYLTAYLKSHLPRVTVTYRRQGKMFAGTLCVFSEEEIQSKVAKERATQDCDELNSLGFRLVFEALVKSRKPCVGHNCFMDLLFLMAALDRALPEELPSWKARVSELFPTVLDTKYIATRVDRFPLGYFKKLNLGSLFENYGMQSQEVKVSLPLGFQSYDPLTFLTLSRRSSSGGTAAGPAHEAGYDALMTGTLLLNLLAEMGYNSVADAPADLVNKTSVFNSLYAVDLGRADGDEYTPGERGVLDLRHAAHVKWFEVEGCVTASGVNNITLHSVDKERTIVVLPPLQDCDPKTIEETLSTRFSHILREVSMYKPPHLA
ncbi:unnamed protein product [Phytomonas sp. EM1]|nr:unnamed protein product [Phytomonas sp. EM1]|eukprot:CCW65365.1 unnamed protein product [Phytomonas sp. isolate EM1]